MAAPTVSVGPRALGVGERKVPLFAGAMDHFAVEPRRWKACLAALRAMGCTTVETAAPWGLHELGPGRFDFTSGARDLAGFLDAVEGEGLLAAVRVGPRISGELLWDGLPTRIATDASLCQRTADGNPSFTLLPPRGYAPPSWGARRFLDEVGGWYGALGEVLAPRFHPRGPVVLLVVDHALGGFLRASPYASDYHPEVLEAWRAEQGDTPPPRRFDATTPAALAPHLAWFAFRERCIAATLGTLCASLDAAGLGGVPRLHGFAALDPLAASAAAVESAVDIAGAHFLHGRAGHAATRQLALQLAGRSRLPIATPLSLGSPPWAPPRQDDEVIALLLGALMHGVAGYVGHMAVARDRWLGAPIEPDGSARKALAEPLARIHRALVAADFTNAHRPVEIGLLVPRAYEQLACASSRLGPLAPLAGLAGLAHLGLREDANGLAGPIAVEQDHARRALVAALDRAGRSFVLLDEHAGAARLSSLSAVVVTSFDFFDVDLAGTLSAYAAAGGTVLWGPRAPSYDAAMQQMTIALPGARLDAATLADPALLDAALATLPAPSGARAIAHGGLASLHLGASGEPALLYLAATQHDGARLSVESPGGRWVDACSGERFGPGSFDVAMPPLGVRLLVPEGA